MLNIDRGPRLCGRLLALFVATGHRRTGVLRRNAVGRARAANDRLVSPRRMVDRGSVSTVCALGPPPCPGQNRRNVSAKRPGCRLLCHRRVHKSLSARLPAYNRSAGRRRGLVRSRGGWKVSIYIRRPPLCRTNSSDFFSSVRPSPNPCDALLYGNPVEVVTAHGQGDRTVTGYNRALPLRARRRRSDSPLAGPFTSRSSTSSTAVSISVALNTPVDSTIARTAWRSLGIGS